MRNPKHILITGASGGLGAALAVRYAAPGIRLSLHGRNTSRLAAVADAANRKGAIVATKPGDVVFEESMTAWINDCEKQYPIDLVIANAGISAGTGRIGESDQQSRAIFNVNLTGLLNTVQPAVPIMAARRRGQIAIMSSLAGFRGFPGAPAYCASKAAVRLYGEALRDELAAKGVEVNVICPGFVKTAMTDTNPFPMPFIMPAERAAGIIHHGLSHNHARIAFPLPMYLAVRLMAALPQDWTKKMVTRMPRKPAKS